MIATRVPVLATALSLVGAIGLPSALADTGWGHPFAAPVQVAQAPSYRVEEVQVEATGSTAGAARDAAFMRGQRRALNELLSQIGAAGQVDVSALGDADISALVQAFQVLSESSVGNRYSATLSYEFQPDAIQDLVGDGFLVPQAVDTRPVLVLPVIRTEDGTRLWDSPNPWLAAWLDSDAAAVDEGVVVPPGELQDVGDISVQGAVTGDLGRLRRIADRYGAGDAVVAIARPGPDALRIDLVRYDRAGGELRDSLTLPGAGGTATGEPALAAAVDEVRDVLLTGATATSVAAAPQPGVETAVPALVMIRSHEDWVRVERTLQTIPFITERRLVSLSTREAVYDLQVAGSLEQLSDLLRQRGIGAEPMGEGLRLTPGAF